MYYSENNKRVFLENDEMIEFQDVADALYELTEALECIAKNYELKGENEKITKAEILTAKKVAGFLADNDDIIIKRKK